MELSFDTVIKWLNFPIVHIGDTPLTLGGLGTAFLVFIGFLFLSSILQKAISPQLEKRFRFSSGVSYAILRFLHYLIVVLGVIIAAQIVGLNLGSLAVVFGFLSVGIGFGLQNVTSNFISGLILLIERPVSVGDFVSVDNQIGRVIQINMRSTIIMTVDNLAIVVPNSKFVENNVTNWSIQDSKVRLHCPVGVAYGSDITTVKEALLSVAKAHPDVLERPEPEVRFLEFGNSSLDFDLLVWTDEPKKQFLLRSQINYAIDEAFRKANVRIPFPQRDLHVQMSPAVDVLAGEEKIMPKFIKKVSKKAGLAPGTLVHVGKKHQQETRITVIDYSKDHFEQKEVKTVEETFAYRDKKSVTWINIDGLEDLNVIKSVDEHFGIHELVAEDICNTGHRPKLEDHEDYLFIILKMLYYNEENKDVTSEQFSFVQGRNYVISFQERIGDVFEPIRERIKAGKGRARKLGADYLAYILIDAMVDNYFAVIEKTGEEIERLEERMMEEVKPEMVEEIHFMKRDTIFLKKQVWPLREVVNAWQKTDGKLISKDISIFLRDVYDHTIQIIDTIESYRDIVSGLHDIYLSNMSNRMNEIMKVLTIFAAIFIPLTFIAGIYGMNFKYIPELEFENGYFVAIGVMALIGFGMLYYFKRKKWL